MLIAGRCRAYQGGAISDILMPYRKLLYLVSMVQGVDAHFASYRVLVNIGVPRAVTQRRLVGMA